MKRGDIIIASTILVAVIISVLLFSLCGTAGKNVVIKQDNRVIATVPISQNKEITLGTNTVEIKNGEVKIIWANCKNQLCKKHTAISKSGESIVCLPNKVVVTIEK